MKTLRSSTPREWVLRNPGGQELSLRLEPGETAIVGRDLTVDLPILDAGISRHHATFEVEGDDLWLEDLHSQNGTFVNTERIRKARILSGDVITFGRVPLTITARKSSPEESDPLKRLSQEDLGRLVHISRELASDRGKVTVLQRLLDLSLDALHANRGAVLLWEESRNHFHPVAASPQDLFGNAPRLIDGSLAASILRGTKARLIAEPAFPGKGSALAAPVSGGEKTLGILYMDRAAGARAFQPSDAEFLSAVVWVASGALDAFTQSSGPDDWTEKIEAVIRRRTRALEGHPELVDGGRFSPGPREESEAASRAASGFLPGLERFLKAEEKRVEGAALRPARLCVEAARRLEERHPWRYDEIAVSRIFAELEGLDRDRRNYRFEEGEGLTVLCDPEDLLLALRLLVEVLERLVAAPSSVPMVLRASLAADSNRIRIDVSRDAGEGSGQGARADAGEEFIVRIALELVETRIHGELGREENPPSFHLYVPQPAISLRETILLPHSGGV